MGQSWGWGVDRHMCGGLSVVLDVGVLGVWLEGHYTGVGVQT